MKLTVLCVGKLKEDAERVIVARYIERAGQVGAPLGLSCSSIVEIPESRAATVLGRKTAEAAELTRRLPPGAATVALDERGRAMTSEEIAERLRQWQDDGTRNAAFIIGGPDGLDPAFTRQASLVLSLGRITLPHGLARAVLAEQLYRAATLMAGHPYHRA